MTVVVCANSEAFQGVLRETKKCSGRVSESGSCDVHLLIPFERLEMLSQDVLSQ